MPAKHRTAYSGWILIVATAPICAAEIAIVTPGSVAFGSQVKVLSNGNVVVTDPNGPAANIGAVYLFSPGGTKISGFTGSSPNDRVGSGGIVTLPNGNFVVVSPHWTNQANANAGAVTWVDGTHGLNGVVSSDNSLVGTSADDKVGFAVDAEAPPYDSPADYSIRVMSNSRFLVISPFWSNGAATQAGAVTVVNGASGIAGAVSAANSLVGTHTDDQVGSYASFLLDNGNAVVVSPQWNSALASKVGAVTWVSGTQGLSGAVSASNSLVGLSANDQVGSSGLCVLTNHHYVVLSPSWNHGAATRAGAATWEDGNAPTSGVVSPANSIVGSAADDQVGVFGGAALTNGNYVVLSPYWNNGAVACAGAATWADGNAGSSGAVTADNSLVGTTLNDQVSSCGVFALSNGNYTVANCVWNNGAISAAGAVTWGNGSTGTSGAVSAANSLVGTSDNDQVGNFGAYVLNNGNYVVTSVYWSHGGVGAFGAATWADGSVGIHGPVSATNSLVGTTPNDLVGIGGVTPLSNGNYVVNSYGWINAGATRAGAITWADGKVGIVGAVSTANSLVGTQMNDRVGLGFVTPLSNGNYVVASPNWANNGVAKAGALTWASGTTPATGAVSVTNSLVGTSTNDGVGTAAFALADGSFIATSPSWNNPGTGASLAGAATWGSGKGLITGAVSAANSLVGISSGDRIGGDIHIGSVDVPPIKPLSDGNFLLLNQNWNRGATPAAGAITLASPRFRLAGTVQAYNSVRGTQANEGATMPFDYDALHARLIVGRPLENAVSVFTMDQLFSDGFE